MAEEVKQNTPENTAQEILAENSTEQPQEVAATTEEQPAVTETPDVSTIVNKTLQDFMGKEQGRLAQVSGQKIAAVEKSLDSKLEQLNQRLEPLMQMANAQERERLLNLDNEQLAEMVIKQRSQPATAQPEPVQQEQQVDPNINALASATQDLITQNGLNMNIEDSRLWEGYTQGMSLLQSIDLARKNIEKVKGVQPQQTQQSASATPTPATPSTQGAPQKSVKTISSLSDAAQLFADGNINSGQYRDAKKQIRNSGSATL
jgi:hypothetical protein